jgi:citrate lyase beta subunit
VGLNITRSLLFCAGKQNPNLRTQIQAKAALAVIDCDDAVGKQDDESALKVYNAIMGGKYR